MRTKNAELKIDLDLVKLNTLLKQRL